MLAIVVLAGVADPPVRLEDWRRRAGLIVAADGGAERALTMGLVPDVVVGDMDSIAPATLAQLQERDATVEVYPRAKDETDAELAVRAALARGARELVILCALGGRLDHSLANILMLDAPDLEGRALLASGAVEVRLIRGDTHFEGAPGDLLSLLPLGDGVVRVRTVDLAYPLIDEPLPAGCARGVSNVFLTERATVRLGGGKLLAIHTRRIGAAKEFRDAAQSGNGDPGDSTG
ncbi:MAG: thiamine diphosphokinase [Anaerolineae bacterium]